MIEFFVDESCGYCTPCRVGNRLLLQGINKILAEHGEAKDLAETSRLWARWSRPRAAAASDRPPPTPC